VEKARRSVVLKGVDQPIVAVDCDLTLLDAHDSPLPGAKEAMSFLHHEGWKLIVWTHRADLDEVRMLLTRYEIPFDFINEDPDTDAKNYSRKVAFDVTVDDKAIHFNGNWSMVVSELEQRRARWRIDEAKEVKIMSADSKQPIAVFALEGGRAVKKSGSDSQIVKELEEFGVESEDGAVVRAEEGSKFLKALSGLRGTYLWAETN